MINPELFVPKSALELPSSEPTEVLLALIGEAELVTFPMQAVGVLAMHASCAPQWREWEDGQGGSMHIVERNGTEVPLASFDKTGDKKEQITPYSTDGYVVHRDERAILVYGASFPDHLSVIWGVGTNHLDELLTEPERVRLLLVYSDNLRDRMHAQLHGANTPEERAALPDQARPVYRP